MSDLRKEIMSRLQTMRDETVQLKEKTAELMERAALSNNHIEELVEQAELSNKRIEHLSEALYCTGQIAVVHHTTILRLVRLLRELDKQNDWVEKCPNLYERLETIQSVAAQSLEEYNERLSAVEEAIQ